MNLLIPLRNLKKTFLKVYEGKTKDLDFARINFLNLERNIRYLQIIPETVENTLPINKAGKLKDSVLSCQLVLTSTTLAVVRWPPWCEEGTA